MIDILPTGTIVKKYYDENQNFIAGRGADGELFAGKDYFKEDFGILSEIESLDEEQGISFTELDQMIDEVCAKLGISKSDILTLSTVELDTKINSKGSENLTLSQDENNNLNQDEISKQNENTLENINAKQEIDLNEKIDDKLTLGEILGVPNGSKLIAVDSNVIQDNENTTRFTCLIKTPNGELQNADMLNQIGGKDSDKNIYETNRDGSKVEEKQVQSSYAIDSPLIEHGILTIRIGQMGTLEIGYGQMDRTSHKDAFTQRLETREMYPVTSKVKNEFSQSKGTDNIPNKIDEIEKHKKHNCNNMTISETDGNPHTGHLHSEDVAEIILSDDKVGDKIGDVFTREEIGECFEQIREKNPNLSDNELIEITKDELSSETEHLPSQEHHH